MDSHITRRRPHGFVDDTAEQPPDQSSLTSPCQTSFTYSPAPPQSSTFSFATITTFLPYVQGEQELTSPINFQATSPHGTIHYDRQYQQPQQTFCEQSFFSSPYQTQPLHQDHSYYPNTLSPRKRQRTEPDMHLPFLSRPSNSHDGQVKPNGAEISDETGDNSGSTMFSQLENFCCPSWSDYSTPTVYTSMPSSSMYEVTTAPAYPTDLASPSHHIAQNQAMASSGAQHSPLFVFSADSHASQQLHEKYPPLQPMTYLSTVTPVGQEPVSTQAFSSQHDDSKTETHSTFLKPEASEHEYQTLDHRTQPQDHMRYQSFGSQQDAPKTVTTSTFMKPEIPEHDYQSVGYRTGHSASHVADTNYTAGIADSKPNHYIVDSLMRYPAQQGYQTSQDYGPQEVERNEHFGFIQLDSQGNRLDLVKHNQKPQATKRGPFKDPKKRAKTAQVRKIGSCIRCRMQRIRCEFDPDSPEDENAPCDGCKKIIANSKIHRMPCRRWKLTDIKLSKPGQVDEPDLKWTHRWQDSATLPEITQWANAEIRNIRLTDGYGKAITVRVRRFKELPSDKKERFIRHDDGTEETIPTEPFGLVDVEAVKLEYEQYLKSGRIQICKALCGPREKLLWKTYQLAWERRDNPRILGDERELLSRTLDLWVAVRLTTKSFEITGDETLGIPPDRTGKVVLPPVMGAQLDKIIIDHILPKLRRETLDLLQSMTQAKRTKTWMTTYLVTFMLLHNVALITRHDKNYAEKHKMKEKFGKEWARAKMVKQYHLGANILLAYFHYCNKGLYPFSKNCKESDLQNLAELDESSLEFVRWTRRYIEDHKRDWEYLRQSDNPNDYGDDYYFISQLFEQDWLPHETTIAG